VDEDAVREGARDQLYASLYHGHLPKLAEDDVVEFDPEAATVAIGENAPQVLEALRGVGGSLDSAQRGHAETSRTRSTENSGGGSSR
jgi:hypothetical protein